MNPRHKLLYPLFFTFILSLISVEPILGNRIIVTNTNDAGPGSLRQAMLDADGNAGPDTILFNIPAGVPGHDAGAGIWIIQPASPLPNMNDDSTFVDGASQASFIGGDPNALGPEIIIDGSNAGGTSGFSFMGSYNTIVHLVVHRFDNSQLTFTGSYNRIAGCFLGTDYSGQNEMGGGIGLSLGGNEHNIIGGIEETDRNVISGNSQTGVKLVSSHHNRIINNYIGINSTGSDVLGNGEEGIDASHSRHNTIGPQNIISGNQKHGLSLFETSDSNTVIGNFIGTDPDGTMDWGNGQYGIALFNGPSQNVIGGDLPEQRNIISGNNSDGIHISGEQSDSNRVIGNFIGTDLTGSSPLPNDGFGIALFSGPRENTIGGENEGEGNLISGNLRSGIYIWGEKTDSNQIIGNRIGSEIDGESPLGNAENGIEITNQANNNRIGPDNVIAYNESHGILIQGSEAIGNTITRNSIFQNGYQGIKNDNGGNRELEPPVITEFGSLSGTAPPNATVEVFSGPDDEGKMVEGNTLADADGNFFWPGNPTGFWITATATDGEGNTSEFSAPRHFGDFLVTTTADTGEGSLRRAIEGTNQSFGPDTIRFNIPQADPGFDGTVWNLLVLSPLPEISDGGTTIDGNSQKTNQGNTNIDGPAIFLNGSEMSESSHGLRIRSPGNIVSGLIISGFDYYGISISGEMSQGNEIRGNYIGTNPSGTDTLGNGNGIYIGNEAEYNRIGGEDEAHRNIISGNRGNGIYVKTDNNVIAGNTIGVDRTGTQNLGNGTSGILISYSRGNRIGGAIQGERNIISGNMGSGIVISGDDARENIVLGNYIGTDASGAIAIPNDGNGIEISYNANRNIIGGFGEGESNVISGNASNGVYLYQLGTDSNHVHCNLIGTTADTTGRLGNGKHGVYIRDRAQHNQIGPENVIRFNMDDGIYVQGNLTNYNRITMNSISDNGGKGIRLNGSANDGIAAPVITDIGSVQGTAPPLSTVEIFSDDQDEGRIFHGMSEADADGFFYWPDTPTGPNVTATATDANGNTSEFSDIFHIGAFVVTTTADTGENSLRWVIQQANRSTAEDTIRFQIPQSDPNYDDNFGVWTIRPDSPLPDITDSNLMIDGFSQSEFIGSDTNPLGPEIILAGFNAGSGSNGFSVFASNIQIHGLTINGFDKSGIYIFRAEMGSIQGCYVGTNAIGSQSIANGYGIYLINSTRYIQIVPRDTLPNLISGNRYAGITLEDSSTHNMIGGNIIGLNRSATDTLGNGNQHGICLYTRSDSNQITHNQIGGNQRGIYISESSANFITNNLIGTDDSWQNDFGNENEGVYFTANDDSTTDNMVIENLIGYNGSYGVRVYGSMAIRNPITGNGIAHNERKGINNSNGGNLEIPPPTILSADETQISGMSDPLRLIEVFSDENDQGQIFLGATTTDDSGRFSFSLMEPPPLSHITVTAIDMMGNTSEFSHEVIVGIRKTVESDNPDQFRLFQNYPNPFNPETTIPFAVKEKCRVRLKIYDILGREVMTLVNKDHGPGYYRVTFDAREMPTGLYLYTIQMKGFYDVKKMVLLE